MSVVVSGATGHLGRLVVEELLARGVPATQLFAAGRRTETLADLGARGVAVRHLDLNLPETLTAAFAGAEQVLLISGSEVVGRPARRLRVRLSSNSSPLAMAVSTAA